LNSSTNDPFETISKINKIWSELANNPLLSDGEMIDIWEETKEYVEKRIIFI
jgi:hypothetical protein